MPLTFNLDILFKEQNNTEALITKASSIILKQGLLYALHIWGGGVNIIDAGGIYMNIYEVLFVKYLINTYVRYLNYTLLVIAELPNDELTGNHTLSLPSLCL